MYINDYGYSNISLDNDTMGLLTKYAHVHYNEGNYLFSAVLAAYLFEYYLHFVTNNRFKDEKTPCHRA